MLICTIAVADLTGRCPLLILSYDYLLVITQPSSSYYTIVNSTGHHTAHDVLLLHRPIFRRVPGPLPTAHMYIHGS